MTYLEIVNDARFRVANRKTHEAESFLKMMGMTRVEAQGWIKAWISGAGDGDACEYDEKGWPK